MVAVHVDLLVMPFPLLGCEVFSARMSISCLKFMSP